MMRANALLIVPEEVEHLAAGAALDALLLDDERMRTAEPPL
jgi:molybdopterin biosynthesis enzyme